MLPALLCNGRGLGLDKYNPCHQTHQNAGQIFHIPGHVEGHEAYDGHWDLVQRPHQAVGGCCCGRQEPQGCKADAESDLRIEGNLDAVGNATRDTMPRTELVTNQSKVL